MSSILTNNSAMVALQTLKGINKSLNDVQGQISTGKSVATAKDNSAVWAISKVMESDVKGFKAISDSLSLGQSTIAVGRQASETVTDLLSQMKEKIVGAQEENVDRVKLQDDINALSDQIKSVVGAAQFNGLNLLKGTADVNVLSSLDRASDGTVSSSDITVARQDLSDDAGVYGTGASLNANVAAVPGGNLSAAGTGDAFSNGGNIMSALVAGTIVAGETYNFQVAGETVSFTTTTTAAGDLAAGLNAAINAAGIEGITSSVATATISITNTNAFDDVEVNTSGGGSATFALTSIGVTATAATTNTSTIESRASDVTFSTGAGVSEGDGYRVSLGGVNYDYIAGKGETFEDVARGLKTVIDGAALTDISTNVTQKAGAWVLELDNNGAAQTLTAVGAAGGEATGGLNGLDQIDVTTDAGAEAALANIETYIDTAIGSAASFGSAQGRIETQADFITALSDSLKSGIGSLVDADMEEASARLQALQVQQQLGVQSLSIANQAPQSLLSLFR
jgi:flagellin